MENLKQINLIFIKGGIQIMNIYSLCSQVSILFCIYMSICVYILDKGIMNDKELKNANRFIYVSMRSLYALVMLGMLVLLFLFIYILFKDITILNNIEFKRGVSLLRYSLMVGVTFGGLMLIKFKNKCKD